VFALGVFVLVLTLSYFTKSRELQDKPPRAVDGVAWKNSSLLLCCLSLRVITGKSRPHRSTQTPGYWPVISQLRNLVAEKLSKRNL
jgi:hypothetical protein